LGQSPYPLFRAGNIIQALRKEKGWSQGELATESGLSREMIGKYERGDAVPFIEAAKKLARALGVSLDYLDCETDGAAFDRKTAERMKDIDRLDAAEREQDGRDNSSNVNNLCSMWPSKRKLPITQEDKEWIEVNLLWLKKLFGHHVEPVTPTPNHFPMEFTGSEADAHRILGIVCGQMDILTGNIEVRFFDPPPMVDDFMLGC